mmetsp:Transcript_51600/g.120372  ORF Transcript_51600/g.120372 Transcript_51600/m.120372 type:complete len:123 (-) Transcript_51600:82-450(-)
MDPKQMAPGVGNWQGCFRLRVQCKATWSGVLVPDRSPAPSTRIRGNGPSALTDPLPDEHGRETQRTAIRLLVHCLWGVEGQSEGEISELSFCCQMCLAHKERTAERGADRAMAAMGRRPLNR